MLLFIHLSLSFAYTLMIKSSSFDDIHVSKNHGIVNQDIISLAMMIKYELLSLIDAKEADVVSNVNMQIRKCKPYKKMTAVLGIGK